MYLVKYILIDLISLLHFSRSVEPCSFITSLTILQLSKLHHVTRSQSHICEWNNTSNSTFKILHYGVLTKKYNQLLIMSNQNKAIFGHIFVAFTWNE